MQAGLLSFPTEHGLHPAEVARLTGARGYASLFFAEHTHIPAGRGTPFPWGVMPRSYAHLYELFVAVTAGLAATSRLRVGTGICLIGQRDPIITAKQVASVDHAYGGRFEFGVGAGWNLEELANHGTQGSQRVAVFRERILAMKEIWAKEEASFAGRHVAFDRIWSWPKPAQRPHPPVLIGGDGPKVLDRVLELGDEWLPNHGPDIAQRAQELFRRAADAGKTVRVTVVGTPPDARVLEAYQAAGISRVLFFLPTGRLATTERAIDDADHAMAELHGTDV